MVASDGRSSSTTAGSDDFDHHVTFNIRGTAHVTHWVVLQGTSTHIYLGTTDEPLVDIIVPVNSGVCPARELLHQHLANWPLLDSRRWSLVDRLLAEAREWLATWSNSPHNVEQLYFDCQMDLRHVIDENMLPQLSMEDSSGGMTPTTESVIESLEKKKFRGCGETSECSICMEEMLDGDEVITLPCTKHVFHEDCIERWLRTSHYCPICRFEMPTC